MKIYVYNENCTSKGQVSMRNDESDEERDDDGDLHLYGEGTEAEIIDAALASLATRYDHRAGGAGDHYRWTCDKNVLKYLSGPEVEFDEATMAYLPATDESDDED
jgi:hypothetical protein